MKSLKRPNEAQLFGEAELRTRHLDTLIQLALLEIENEKAEALQKIVDQDAAEISVAEMDATFEEAHTRFARFLEREAGKVSRKRFVRRTLPRVVQIAAAILLVCYLGATAVLAASRSMRVRVLEFMTNMGEEYAELALVESPIELEIPTEWMGSLYPRYLPEGYVFTTVERDGYRLVFTSPAEKTIMLTEYDKDSVVNMDTENSEIKYVPFSGGVVLMATKNERSLITWADYDHFYLLRVYEPEEEVIRILDGLQKIR